MLMPATGMLLACLPMSLGAKVGFNAVTYNAAPDCVHVCQVTAYMLVIAATAQQHGGTHHCSTGARTFCTVIHLHLELIYSFCLSSFHV
jgi:hypothetical protein